MAVSGRSGHARRARLGSGQTVPVPWLLCEDRVLASVEVADSRSARRRGLLGRDGVDGALLLPGVRSVHTIGMRFPIDVAHLGDDGEVLRIRTMRPWRLGMPVRGARAVLEADAGAFGHWGLTEGCRTEVRS